MLLAIILSLTLQEVEPAKEIYVEEISVLPAPVEQVEPATPAFIGYAENHDTDDPEKVRSLSEIINPYTATSPDQCGSGVDDARIEDLRRSPQFADNPEELESIIDIWEDMEARCLRMFDQDEYR